MFVGLTGSHPGVIATLGFPEHRVNGFHSFDQFICLGLIDVDLAGAAELGRFPEDVMQIRESCQMLWLEIIRPQDQQFVLGLLSLFFLDGDEAGEGVVVSRPSSRIVA